MANNYSFATNIQTILLNISTKHVSKSQKKWRVACIVIYISLSLSKQAINARKIKTEHVICYNASSSPHTVLEIHDDDDDDDTELITSTELNHTKLIETIKNKNLEHLNRYGGTEAVLKFLESNTENGINGDEEDLTKRRLKYGSNTYHRPPSKGLIFYIVEAFKDLIILILIACAVLSLVFGIREDGLKEGWYEGGSILIAVFLVITVSASSNYRQEKQFESWSETSSDVKVEVVRYQRRQKVSIFDIVVGDIVVLSIGDRVPADGLFINGHSLQVDESSMTGENDHVAVNTGRNPFLISGSKVVDGFSKMLVTSVGSNTAWGEIMGSIANGPRDRTPLQERLDKLTSSIGKLGLGVACLVLVILLVRYFTGSTKDENGLREFGVKDKDLKDVFNSVIRMVSDAVTIIVVAIPEGLPLAVTLSLAYSMKRMMRDQAMVRKLSACETMGSAQVICTDKTGTLTLNQMRVTKICIGFEETVSSVLIGPDLLELFYQGVYFNTMGSIYGPGPKSSVEYSGSPTEKAVLRWAFEELNMDVERLKQDYEVLSVETFNSEKKRSGVSIKNKNNGDCFVHWKGAAEIILSMCSGYKELNGETMSMSQENRTRFERVIKGMFAKSLRCIAFANKQIKPEEHFNSNLDDDDDDKSSYHNISERDLTFLGVIGMKDPCRPGVREAVEACKNAGVHVKMITGDNTFTAKAIAIECGILDHNHRHITDNEDGSVIEGAVFRNYTHEQRMLKLDNIRVMARSSPSDKLLMVQCLKQKGQVVAVTGDGTNDAPALREADIGLSMGLQGTEVAKESSDIVILDDDFASVAKVLIWGRCVYNNIQKFVQFQLTVNVAALVINFVSSISSGEVPLTAVQLLWVNLIMDTLGALALATEGPTKELTCRPPVGRTEPLITNVMWRNILAQSSYQIVVLMILQFQGGSILNVGDEVKGTIIFNSFVLCQVFNEFNSRSLEKRNVFEGIHKNRVFVAIAAITVVLQVLMVECLRKFAGTVRLNWGQWCVCVVIGALTWPVGWVVKCVRV